MQQVRPSALERWYSRYGARARYDLSSSAAPALRTDELLELAGDAARADYLALDLGYRPAQGSACLRTVIAEQYTTLDGEHIQVTTGAAEAIFLLLHACVQPDDRLIVQSPIYPSFYTLAAGLGAQVRLWPFDVQGRVDLELLARLLGRGQVRAIVLNHPHSPTGALLSAAELAGIAALAAAHEALLIVDEVYRGIQFEGPLTAAAADLGDHVVSIGDLAKPYGLGGLRVGWVATANQALLERCAHLRDYTSLCNSAPGEYLAVLALEQRERILTRQLDIARRNRRCFLEVLASEPWLDARLGPGGFTIFPQVHLPLPTLRISAELCEQEQVLVLPGEVFERVGHLRIGFGVAPDDFVAGLERLAAYGARRWRGGR
jgi:aspartate/methionine/tyrosine aminotransferase